MKQALFVLVFWVLSAATLSAQGLDQANNKVGDAIYELNAIVDEMKANQDRIGELQGELQEMEKDAHASQEALVTQRQLLDEYKKKVDVLKDRYDSVLAVAEKLKADLQLSQTINWVAIPVAILALGFAAVEGYVILSKGSQRGTK